MPSWKLVIDRLPQENDRRYKQEADAGELVNLVLIVSKNYKHHKSVEYDSSRLRIQTWREDKVE